MVDFSEFTEECKKDLDRLADTRPALQRALGTYWTSRWAHGKPLGCIPYGLPDWQAWEIYCTVLSGEWDKRYGESA